MNKKEKQIIKSILWKKQKGRCFCCGKGGKEKRGKTTHYNLQLHHIIPKAYGGGDELNNLVLVCNECHKEIHKEIERRRDNLGYAFYRGALITIREIKQMERDKYEWIVRKKKEKDKKESKKYKNRN